MSRNRTEAHWTSEESIVKGNKRRNAWWAIPLALIASIAVIYYAYSRAVGLADVTYEVRQCQETLDADSTWEQVQAAACDPVSTEGMTMRLHDDKSSVMDANEVTEHTFVFEDVPVNTAATGMSLEIERPAASVVLAEPENETIRRELTSNAQKTLWSANVGGRGPTTYWVLITPIDR